MPLSRSSFCSVVHQILVEFIQNVTIHILQSDLQRSEVRDDLLVHQHSVSAIRCGGKVSSLKHRIPSTLRAVFAQEYHYSPWSLSWLAALCCVQRSPAHSLSLARTDATLYQSQRFEVMAPMSGSLPLRARPGVPSASQYSIFKGRKSFLPLTCLWTFFETNATIRQNIFLLFPVFARPPCLLLVLRHQYALHTSSVSFLL